MEVYAYLKHLSISENSTHLIIERANTLHLMLYGDKFIDSVDINWRELNASNKINVNSRIFIHDVISCWGHNMYEKMKLKQEARINEYQMQRKINELL